MIVSQSLTSIATHLDQERVSHYGMNQGWVKGGYCRVHTADRSYFIEFIVDGRIERVFVDVYPQIVVEKPYRHMVHAYVNEKTSGFRSGRVDIDSDTGELKIRVETSIVDRAVSVEDIKDMEMIAIHIADSLYRRLDKLAHGVFFHDDDPDVMSDAEKAAKDLDKKLRQVSDEMRRGLGQEDAEDVWDDEWEEELDEELDEDLDALVKSIDPDDEEEQDDVVDVVLESSGGRRLCLMLYIQEITGVPMIEAMHMLESTPVTILTSITRERAQEVVNRLKEEGAVANIRS